MEAMQSGQIEFTKNYQHYHQYVTNIAYSNIGNREDAEDLCQDLFIVYYKSMGKVNDTRRWINGTMRNHMYSYYRKQNRYSFDMKEINESEVAARDAQYEVNDVIDENIFNEGNFKNGLDEQIFVLRAIQGLSYRAVAENLGLTKRQVHYRYIQIMRRIRSKLMEIGISCLADVVG